MRLTLPLAALLLLATGCPNYTPYLPDGGRVRTQCDNQTVGAPVTIRDRLGDPAPQAVVVVEYVDDAETENLVANDQGVAVVRHKYGYGTVRVQGFVNDLQTLKGELQFIGNDCSAAVTPRELFLQLQ